MCIEDSVPSPQKGGYGMGGVLELMKLNKGQGVSPSRRNYFTPRITIALLSVSTDSLCFPSL